jgi:hypothetical protein
MNIWRKMMLRRMMLKRLCRYWIIGRRGSDAYGILRSWRLRIMNMWRRKLLRSLFS